MNVSFAKAHSNQDLVSFLHQHLPPFVIKRLSPFLGERVENWQFSLPSNLPFSGVRLIPDKDRVQVAVGQVFKSRDFFRPMVDNYTFQNRVCTKGIEDNLKVDSPSPFDRPMLREYQEMMVDIALRNSLHRKQQFDQGSSTEDRVAAFGILLDSRNDLIKEEILQHTIKEAVQSEIARRDP